MAAAPAAVPDPFNLRDVVNEVVAESGLSDPGEIAELTRKRIPDDQREEALAQTMRAFVRHVLQEHRRRVWPEGGQGQHLEPAQPSAVPPRAAGRGKLPPRPTYSAKRAGIRDAWPEFLEGRFHVGGAWMRYGDCGVEELGFIAAERRAKAASNAAEAERHERVRALLVERGVARVRDLPPDALGGVFGVSAA